MDKILHTETTKIYMKNKKLKNYHKVTQEN